MRRTGRPRDRAARAASSGEARPASPRAGDGQRPDDAVQIGEFGRAHGLRGEVRLKSFTEDPLAVARYEPLFDDYGRRLRITALRPAPGSAADMLIASIEGIADRDLAEALNRRGVFTTRAAIAATGAGEDEFLLADLIGMSVERPDGAVIGRVVAVPDYGAGDLLEITPLAGGASALVPFLKSFVPTVDLAGRRVVVEAPDDLFAPAGPEPKPGEE